LERETITLVLEEQEQSEGESVFVELDRLRDRRGTLFDGAEKGGDMASKAEEFLDRVRKKYEEIWEDETDANREFLLDWLLPQLRFMGMEGKS
jgi:hypothetical protein